MSKDIRCKAYRASFRDKHALKHHNKAKHGPRELSKLVLKLAVFLGVIVAIDYLGFELKMKRDKTRDMVANQYQTKSRRISALVSGFLIHSLSQIKEQSHKENIRESHLTEIETLQVVRQGEEVLCRRMI